MDEGRWDVGGGGAGAERREVVGERGDVGSSRWELRNGRWLVELGDGKWEMGGGGGMWKVGAGRCEMEVGR